VVAFVVDVVVVVFVTSLADGSLSLSLSLVATDPLECRQTRFRCSIKTQQRQPMQEHSDRCSLALIVHAKRRKDSGPPAWYGAPDLDEGLVCECDKQWWSPVRFCSSGNRSVSPRTTTRGWVDKSRREGNIRECQFLGFPLRVPVRSAWMYGPSKNTMRNWFDVTMLVVDFALCG